MIIQLISRDTWKPRGIDELEPNADWAVRTDSNTLVVAGPGAGKTELLAQRACFLLETGACLHPQRILAISFKRDAARNLRDRVVKRCGRDLGRRLDSLTFDAFAKAMLDQFLHGLPADLRPTSTYDVLPGGPRDGDVRDVLSRMTLPPNLGQQNALRAFESEGFYRNKVLNVSFATEPKDLEGWAAREFWRVMLHGDAVSKLYFPMITRLAGELIRADPRVQKAYRSTYSHVFLDEFQDATALQYWLTRVLYQGTAAVLTAVGDSQQRIMVWAGAQRDVFVRFCEHFGAGERRLERNRRASATIAPIVAYLAARMREQFDGDTTAIPPLVGESGPPPEACAAFLFADEASEAEWIAAEIKGIIDAGTAPREVSILARMKTAEYAGAVMDALRLQGVESRFEEVMQDLLVEPVVQLTLLGLRALLGGSPGAAWAEFRDEIARTLGQDENEHTTLARLDRTLQDLRRNLRVQQGTPSNDAQAIRLLVRQHVEPLFLVSMRNRYAQYKRGTFYEDTLTKLCNAVAGSNASDWDAVLDAVEGLHAVPILTIHKSKGLEYTAVFFVGLEDNAFWNFRRTPDEELNAFFVAISRAKQRVAFTFAQNRDLAGRSGGFQTRSGIGQVYELLEEARVPIVDMTRPAS